MEAKLNIHHQQGIHLNLELLDHQDFSVSEFFRHNFLKKSENSNSKQLNFKKLQDSVPLIQDIQRQTCEKIVSLVDEHLNEYIEISTRFDKMKEPLNKTNELFTEFAKPFGEFIETAEDTRKQ